MSAVDIAVVADDLSGAAESAAVGLMRVPRSTVLLSNTSSEARLWLTNERTCTDDVPRMATVDTHTRHLDAQTAAEAVQGVVPLLRDARLVVKKVDSLLRGNIGAEVAALSRSLGRTPVVAPSLPRLGRVVHAGVLHVDGVPLHQTGLWHLEPQSCPRSVADTMAPLPTVEVAQTVVDAGVHHVAQALEAAEAQGLVPICDADDDASLTVIAQAARQLWDRPLLVGSASMVGAALATLNPQDRQSAPEMHSSGTTEEGHLRAGSSVGAGVLVVVGSRAPSIQGQLHRLAPHAAYQLLVDPTQLLKAPEEVRRSLHGMPTHGICVVALDPSAEVEASRSRVLANALADVVAPSLGSFPAVVASGGETARALLDAVGVDRLEALVEIEPGAVATRTPEGQTFVTRPGSFGGPDSLLHITRGLLEGSATQEENHE
jgi:4-hydroxythreonine-4-phosphate dehydrogenase